MNCNQLLVKPWTYIKCIVVKIIFIDTSTELITEISSIKFADGLKLGTYCIIIIKITNKLN